MTFLQPFILFGLPLIGLPILIHLINRQRHRTVPWGAMMFLLDAKRLQKNMAKLRYWIIMAMRMLAVAAILFAASRPFASGWLGSTVGARADTTILILDRSPSMEQQDPLTQQTKRETALRKLASFLQTTAGNRRTVLIESTRNEAEEIEVQQLTSLPSTMSSSSPSDVPRMLQTALDYVVDNEIGQADIWIASDLRQSDWRPDDGRWAAVRQAFAEREGIRFHLLAYPQVSSNNLSVAVRDVRKRSVGGEHELVLDVVVQRENADAPAQTLPLEFVVNGARSVVEIELDKDEHVLQGHVIPIDRSVQAGWGRVEISGDENTGDNQYYFVFADEATRLTSIVSDDPESTSPLRIAASRGPDPSLTFQSVVHTSSQIAELDWEHTSLVIWQAPLPTGIVAEQMQAYLESGRPVLFFPPLSPNQNEFLGLRWNAWQSPNENSPIGIASMLGDSDLLQRTQSGRALPLNQQRTARYCQLEGPGKSLARFTSGDHLLLRAANDIPAYFCTTLPRPEYSSLARDGVVLYVMIQRAIELGAAYQGDARNVSAGTADPNEIAGWTLLSDLPTHVVSSSRADHAAAYQVDESAFVSINRPTEEDDYRAMNKAAMESVLSGLDYHIISDELGEDSPLANEIWRVFLALMAIALVVEASLCLQ